MPEVWKYLETGKVRHKFSRAESDRPICCIRIYGYYTVIPWRTNKTKLDKLPKCKSCLNPVWAKSEELL